MTDARLSGHFSRFLGEGTRVEQLAHGVELWRYERPEFVSFITNGLSTVDVAALKPQELVCSVQPGQDGAAAQLVTTMLDQIIATDRGPVVDQLIPAKTPILERTNIYGLLATTHPFLDDAFNVVRDTDGTITVQIVTLLPLTAPEVRQAESAGLDALIDLLEEVNPPLLDVTR